MTRSLARRRATPAVSALLVTAAALVPAAPSSWSEDGAAPEAAEPWSPRVADALEPLLGHLGIGPQDLAPPRPWPPADLALPPPRRCLEGPGRTVREAAPLMQLSRQAGTLGGASELAFLLHSMAGGWLGVPTEEGLRLRAEGTAAKQLEMMAGELNRWQEALPSLSEDWAAALAQLVVDLARTRELADRALGGLSAEDRQKLEAALDTLIAPSAGTDPLELGAQLMRADRLDRRTLVQAAAAALLSVDAFLQLQPGTEPTIGWRSDVPGVGGLAAGPFETPAGPVHLGGPGPNRWAVAEGVIVDFGGRDRYEPETGNTASGGEAGLFVVLDLSGDDVYADASPGRLGVGRFGLGLLRDLGGDDLYSGGLLTQGAAWVGAGLMIDDGGDDLYRARRWAQGSAGVGLGLLVDGGGTDSYAAAHQSQGFATTLGAGVLADRSGDDGYRLVAAAGDGEPATGVGSGGLGQGAAEGHPDAEIAGGVGALWDASGNDTYRASSRAQGHGLWHSAGWLVDGAGNDAFTLDGAGQGHGQRFGVGACFDLAGDDVRTARSGPAFGSGEAAGLGLLFDAAGNDAVSSARGGLGRAADRSAALYLDAGGDDVYLPRDPLRSLGHGAPAGGFGGWGLFVDAAGDDRYAGNRADNGRVWTSGYWGGGIDRSPDRGRDEASASAASPGPPDLEYRPPRGLSPAEAVARLDDPQPAVRAGAARALGALGGPDEATLLVGIAREDPSGWVRGAASLALAELGRETAGPAVLSGLQRCASPEARARECQLLVRAVASWLGTLPDRTPPEEGSELRRTLERIATLGPEETGALIMELIFDVRLEP